MKIIIEADADEAELAERVRDKIMRRVSAADGITEVRNVGGRRSVPITRTDTSSGETVEVRGQRTASHPDGN